MAQGRESWGGEVRLPRWLRRVLRHPADPGESPERARERAREERQRKQPTVSARENIDRAGSGTFFS